MDSQKKERIAFLCHQFSGAPTGELLVSGRVSLRVKRIDVFFFPFFPDMLYSSLESLCQIHGVNFGCESDVNLFFVDIWRWILMLACFNKRPAKRLARWCDNLNQRRNYGLIHLSHHPHPNMNYIYQFLFQSIVHPKPSAESRVFCSSTAPRRSFTSVTELNWDLDWKTVFWTTARYKA